jgi:pimeloyl-ACP methyl ester carboxylesterase
MLGRRPRGILEIFWACLESTAQGRTEHRPTSADFPDSVVRRVTFTAGGGLGWKLSALTTPRPSPTPWKVVVITGTPSWAEYWAPVMAALPPDREMVVVDRPGFAGSEPLTAVPDLTVQAAALSPVLQAAPGQRVLLVGQSYGAAIAALMAAGRPKTLGGLVLLSAYLGELGPTARWLVGLGSHASTVAPRDLRNAIAEVTLQRNQVEVMRRELPKVLVPIHFVHGELDDFAPIGAVRKMTSEIRARRPIQLTSVADANHFLNDGPADRLLGALGPCMPAPRPGWNWRWPTLPPIPAFGVIQAG